VAELQQCTSQLPASEISTSSCARNTALPDFFSLFGMDQYAYYYVMFRVYPVVLAIRNSR
jgi:hypothetical protein